MKRLFSIISGFLFTATITAQDINVVINEPEVNRVLSTLASDDMQGRRAFTPGIEKAAAFIGEVFQKIGLQNL